MKDEDPDDTPEPTTLWVDQKELVRDIGIDDVRAALLTRQEAVMEALVE